MKRNVISLISFLVVCLSSISAYAALVEVDDPTFGIGSITRDTQTNTDWLDLTVSNGYSYNEIMANLLSGGVFEDYRMATQSEVMVLWNHAGLPSFSEGDENFGLYFPILFLQNFIGVTERTYFGPSSTAITWGYCVPSTMNESQAYIIYADNFNGMGGVGIGYDVHKGNLVPLAGAYLTKPSSVPIPAAVWLFISGLLGLIGVRKRITG